MSTLSDPTAPFEQGRARLQAGLAARYGTGHAGEAGAVPLVVPLGTADTLGCGLPDPYGAVRPAATVHLTSRAVLIGPWGGTDQPGADAANPAAPPAPAACGQCLAMRWQRLRSRSEREALELGHAPNGANGWPLLTDYAVDAVWSVCRFVLPGSNRAENRAESRAGTRPGAPLAATRPPARQVPLVTTTPADRALRQVTRVDLGTLAVVTLPLLPEPLCPHCVRPRTETAETSRIRPATARKPDPGSYRVRSLDSFPLPTAALANPVCGALGSDTWINPASTTTAPVAGSNFVRGYAGLNDVTWSGQANSYATSRTLAFLEGLERYAGTHRRRGTLPVSASYRTLAAGRDVVLDPADCGFYAPETYAEDPMVAPFDPEREIPWVWGHSLRDDRPILVPARLVHYSAGSAADNFVFECSNGCATGGSIEEAVLFGLLELIERDAFLLAWYGRARLSRIELDSFDGGTDGGTDGGSTGHGAGAGGTIRTMLDRAALHGYDVHAFDARMDLSVPVVTALAVRRDGGPGTLSFSAAAGFDPEATVESALSEVLTYIPHLPYQVADRQQELEAMAADFGRVKHLKDHAQLYGLPSMTEHAREYLEPAPALPLGHTFARWEAMRPRTEDLLDDLILLRDELTDAGYDVIAVDQTTPEQRRMGLHTVSTTVPGLLPLDFGWNRQRALRMPRLRTGLRRAGRRTDDLTGADLKKAPHPFP